jgi:hypothetical protein
MGGEACDIGDDRIGRVLVVLALGEVKQFAGTHQPFGQVADAIDGLVEIGAFAPQRLRALRVVPDVRILEFAFYFLKPFVLAVVVKETPSAHPADRSGRRCAGGRD